LRSLWGNSRGSSSLLDRTILADQRQHEAARAQQLAPGRLRIRVGVEDHHHIAVDQRGGAVLDHLHLLDIARIGGGVGEHHDQAGDPLKRARLGLGRRQDLQTRHLRRRGGRGQRAQRGNGKGEMSEQGYHCGPYSSGRPGRHPLASVSTWR
jgi:hypothetical protein